MRRTVRGCFRENLPRCVRKRAQDNLASDIFSINYKSLSQGDRISSKWFTAKIEEIFKVAELKPGLDFI